jgi:hypothetical protein
MIPGSIVPPAASITVAPPEIRKLVASPIAAIRSPWTTTIPSTIDGAPVPSMTVPFLTTRASAGIPVRSCPHATTVIVVSAKWSTYLIYCVLLLTTIPSGHQTKAD